MKRMISFLLAMCLVLTAFPAAVFAHTGTPDQEFLPHDETPSEPVESEPSEPIETGPSQPEHTHVPETRNAKEPTCEGYGYTGDVYCSECGELLEEGKTIGPSGHVYGDWYVDEYPSDESIGIKKQRCVICDRGAYSGVMFPEKDHEDGYDIIANCNDVGSLRLSIDKARPGHVVFVEMRFPGGYYPAAIYYGTDADSMEAPGSYGDYIWFVMPEGTLYIDIVFAKYPSVSNPFTDVSKSSYYYVPVLWAFENGITAGTDATHFSPNQNCTRAQVVTFLWRACGEPEPQITECPFTDLNSSAYYYKAVLWALENGITSGTDATHFSPEQSCTRAQVVTFLWRTCGKPDPVSTSSPFIDTKENAYYHLAVLWAVENGITAGTAPNQFSPDSSCTRGQIVTFLYRVLVI